jgi:opacity protein-like surface antigen
MKKALVLFAVLILAAGAVEAKKKKFIFYVGPELAVPVDPPDFQTWWNAAPGISGSLAFKPAPRYEWKIRLGFHSFSYQAPEGFDLDQGDVTAVELTGGIKANLLTQQQNVIAIPYVLGGVGIVHIEASNVIDTVTQEIVRQLDKQETKPALYAGLGIDIPLSRSTSLFFEGRYLLVFTKGDNTGYAPFTLGIRTFL